MGYAKSFGQDHRARPHVETIQAVIVNNEVITRKMTEEERQRLANLQPPKEVKRYKPPKKGKLARKRDVNER